MTALHGCEVVARTVTELSWRPPRCCELTAVTTVRDNTGAPRGVCELHAHRPHITFTVRKRDQHA